MTYLPVKLVGVSLVILGMEWGYHFWRKFRWDPVGTVVDEVEAALWTWRTEHPNEYRLALGSVVGAASVIYLGASVLFVGWQVVSWDQFFAAWRSTEAAQWATFSGWVVPLMLGWGVLAAWFSEEMRHPILPAALADFLGCVFRAAVAIATILMWAKALPEFNGTLVGGLVGGVTSLTVFASTWTGGLGRWTRHLPEAGEDPTITTASDYPLSYLCLSAFLLLFAYIFLVGTPVAK